VFSPSIHACQLGDFARRHARVEVVQESKVKKERKKQNKKKKGMKNRR
jgi:hypothetical protein